MDFRYVPGSSMPENRASRFDQALDLVQLGLLTPDQFWRWTQKDISKEILEELLQQKKQQQDMMMQQQDIVQNSTDPNPLIGSGLCPGLEIRDITFQQPGDVEIKNKRNNYFGR